MENEATKRTKARGLLARRDAKALSAALTTGPTTTKKPHEAVTPTPEWAEVFHYTHSLRQLGGVVFCATCSSLATRRRKFLLDSKCRGPPPTGSTTRLNTLLAGRKPQGCTTWPDGLGPGPRTVIALNYDNEGKNGGSEQAQT